ncbi:hypothetical protein Tco_1445888 [Tanacetum coccineum]
MVIRKRRYVAIEDFKLKRPWATDNNKEIDWTKEFDAEPVTFAMMALTELEEDDWSMEIDAEFVHFGQDGLSDFDWSNKDDTPVSLTLMATNSEVKLEKWTNDAVLQNEVLNKQRYLSDKSCIGFGVESSSSKESDNSSGNINLTESLANALYDTGRDELAIRNKVINQENTKSRQPEIDRNKVIIEDRVDSD